jgi:hypothetical protein
MEWQHDKVALLRIFAPSRAAKGFGFREIRAFRGSHFSRLSRVSRFDRGNAMTFAPVFTITNRMTQASTCIEEAGREAT